MKKAYKAPEITKGLGGVTSVFVRPVVGVVIQPEIGLTHKMPESGASVPVNAYYLRLLAMGDIEQVKESAVRNNDVAESPVSSDLNGSNAKPSKQAKTA